MLARPKTEPELPAFSVECLGSTLRVVDAEGSDVELIGPVSIENRAKAEARASALEDRRADDLMPPKKPRKPKPSSPIPAERVGTERSHSRMLDVEGLDLDARRMENTAPHLEPARGDVAQLTPGKAKKLRAAVMRACPCRLCALCLNPPTTFEEATRFGFDIIRREHDIMEAQRALRIAQARTPPDPQRVNEAERELKKLKAVPR